MIRIRTAAAAGLAELGGSGLVVPTARLGTGTASSSTFLRGDQTWASTGAASAMTQISLNTLSGTATNFDLTSISGSYTHLKLYLLLRGDGTTNNPTFRLNGDSGSNYDRQTFGMNNATNASGAASAESSMLLQPYTGSGQSANVFTYYEIDVPFYAATTAYKVVLSASGFFGTLGTTSSYETDRSAWLWRSTSAINQITVAPASGNWIAGSAAALYGIT